ncbi:OmpA family protein [Spirochaetota bacterium]
MRKVTILILIFFVFYFDNAYSWEKKDASKAIQIAETRLNSVDNMSGLYTFVPYDTYHDAIIFLIISRNYLKEGKMNLSYFYATLSIIRVKTAINIAKTRSFNYKTVLLEAKFQKTKTDKCYTKIKAIKNEIIKSNVKKDIVKKQITKVVDTKFKYLKLIIDANLIKKGSAFTVTLFDRDIFEKGEYTLNSHGMNTLDNIIKVVNKYPKSEIQIVGHTRFLDKKRKSEKKAKALSNYFTKNGIEQNSIEVTGLGNREVMNTAMGFRRVDRIVIVITGIELPVSD